MEYDRIIIRYGELGLKGKNIKMFLVKLQQNIQQSLIRYPNVSVKRTQGRIFVLLNGHSADEIIEICRDIFGVKSLSLAIKIKNDEAEIKQTSLDLLSREGGNKTFKVNTRRAYKDFPIDSMKMNRSLGGHIIRSLSNFKVDIHNPDIELRVEIRAEGTYIMSEVINGPGGLPVGTGGKSLLLLSGGIDSPVAGYLMMKRGIELEMIHFYSPPFTSERAKQKVLDLTKKLTKYNHQIKVHIVPFTEVQQKLVKLYPDRYGMTITRRIMMKISEVICNKEKILSITTGESLGQVASQTMSSMNAINEVTTLPILRPLVAMDKEEIIDVSRKIGTYDISIQPYEDCCTVFVPKHPITSPVREKVVEIENTYDLTKEITEAIDNTKVIKITSKDDKEVDDLL